MATACRIPLGCVEVIVRERDLVTWAIGEVAEQAGVTPRTVRYYVVEGLLPVPGGAGQQRTYTAEHLRRLRAIKRLKEAYLPLDEIRRRLAVLPPEEVERLADAPAAREAESALDYLATVLARHGGGRFQYVETARHIPDCVRGELGEMLQVSARGVALEIRLPQWRRQRPGRRRSDAGCPARRAGPRRGCPDRFTGDASHGRGGTGWAPTQGVAQPVVPHPRGSPPLRPGLADGSERTNPDGHIGTGWSGPPWLKEA